MVKTVIRSKYGPETFDDATDFEIEQGALLIERNNGKSWKVYAPGHWFEADINVVAGELERL